MKDNSNVLDSMYEEIRLIKETQRKKIILLRNRSSGDYSIAKIQFRQEQNVSQERTVRHEGKFFLEMQGHIGIPLMRWVGKDGLYDVLIIQKLGQTLHELFQKCNRKFSLKTITMLGIRMLKIIQNYHQKGFIHKNLTPKDFQMGISERNTILYLNDLMDSQTYINKKTNKHIQNRYNLRVTSFGLNMFMSAEQIRGEQPSRRTDIQAVIFMLIYFSLGELPWQNAIHEDIIIQNKIKKINKIRLQTKLQTICRNLPKQFLQMAKKSRQMGFDEQPNYYYYIQQLLKVMYHHHIQDDQIFDWMVNIDPNTFQSPEQKRLRITKISPSIKIKLQTYQDEVVNRFYKPYQEDLQIDDITPKHQQFLDKKNEGDKLYRNWEETGTVNNSTVIKQAPPRKIKRVEKQKCLIY